MFVIRQQQIDELYKQRLRETVESHAAHFRSTLPVATGHLDEDTLRERIRTGIANALEYGIERAPELTIYLMMSVVLGPAFRDNASVDGFLRHPDLDPKAKLAILLEQFRAQIRNVDAGHTAMLSDTRAEGNGRK